MGRWSLENKGVALIILEQLYPTLTLRPDNQRVGAAPEPVVSPTNVQLLLNTFPEAPDDYLELLNTHDGMILTSDEPSFYIWVFSAIDSLCTMTEWHTWLTERMPGAFFFGRSGDDVFLLG